MSFLPVKQSTIEIGSFDQWKHFPNLCRCHQFRFDSHGLEDRSHVLEIFPTRLACRQNDAACVFDADVLAALFLNVLVQIDGIGLKARDVQVVVQRMKSTCRMPSGPCSQLPALNQSDIRPTLLCEVIKNTGTDNATADDHPHDTDYSY